MSLANKLVATNLGKNDSPYKPVESASDEDANTDNTVDVVRHALVLVLAGVIGGDEGSNHEVHVAEKEEDGDRQSSLDGSVPVVLLAVEV